MAINNSRELPTTDSQRYTTECKKMYNGKKEERFDLFKREYVSPNLEDTQQISILSYYPTSDFKSVVTELIEAFPTNFKVSGENSDYIIQNLIENSYFKRVYAEIVKECILSVKAFVVPKLRLDTMDDGRTAWVFDFRILPYEECYPVYDVMTGELIKLTHKFKKDVRTLENNIVTANSDTIYSMDKIVVSYTDINGKNIIGYENDKVMDNPFKSYGIFPVFEFESINDNDKPITYQLIEPQLQIENLNYNIENSINYQGSPVWKVTNTLRDWDGVVIAPNSVIALMGEENLEQVGGQLQIEALNSRMREKVDKLYSQAGLTPPSLRKEMYATDSSGVAKLAQAPLVSKIKIIMSFHKKPLNILAKLILEWNGEIYSNEKIMPPEEVLPVNLQEVLSNWAIGMNLGLLDDVIFWDTYFPEFTDSDRERIRTLFTERREVGLLDETNNTNIDNTAKIAGNKEQATKMTKEERDVNVTK